MAHNYIDKMPVDGFVTYYESLTYTQWGEIFFYARIAEEFNQASNARLPRFERLDEEIGVLNRIFCLLVFVVSNIFISQRSIE